MKKFLINRNKPDLIQTTKSIDNKNIKLNLTNKENSKRLSKTNNHFINLKKALIGKKLEDSNMTKRQSNRNLKQKSIDYTFQNYIMNNTINKRSIGLPNQNINIVKFPKKKNNIKKKLSNDHYINKNKKGNNIKQTKNSTKDNLSKKGGTNENLSKSNDRTYEDENLRSNKKMVTTIVKIEDLTKIPKRINGTRNRYADYDYNEAKKAAVTCRRIEYSYNLRGVIKSEICLDEIIMIQRWWRDILRKRKEEILEELAIFEKIKKNDIQKYISFLNKISYIYIMHLFKQFMDILKIRYGKLYNKNLLRRNAIKIQRAFRRFLSRRKTEKMNKLEKLLNKYKYKKKKEKLFQEIKNNQKIFNKLRFLQNFVKYYLLRKQEKYFLKLAHEIHPFLYYYYKYRIQKNKNNIYEYKKKTEKFVNYLEKWKKLLKQKRMIKCITFLEYIKFIIIKKFFIFFILRLVERINSMITYFLLQPLMKKILRNYYLVKIRKAFYIWKNNDIIMQKKNKLALNLITKIIKIYSIDCLKKKLLINK